MNFIYIITWCINLENRILFLMPMHIVMLKNNRAAPFTNMV